MKWTLSFCSAAIANLCPWASMWKHIICILLATTCLLQIGMIASMSGKLADEMDFKFLLSSHRKLVSVGFDVETHHLHPACYDLLATDRNDRKYVGKTCR